MLQIYHHAQETLEIAQMLKRNPVQSFLQDFAIQEAHYPCRLPEVA
jgi:hypothetical protein